MMFMPKESSMEEWKTTLEGGHWSLKNMDCWITIANGR